MPNGFGVNTEIEFPIAPVSFHPVFAPRLFRIHRNKAGKGGKPGCPFHQLYRLYPDRPGKVSSRFVLITDT